MSVELLDVPSFNDVLDMLRELHNQKGADYDHGRLYGNIRGSEEFGIEPWVGAMVRANDKMRRIQKFASTKDLKNESVTDSLLDLAVYACISYILFRESVAASQ